MVFHNDLIEILNDRITYEEENIYSDQAIRDNNIELLQSVKQDLLDVDHYNDWTHIGTRSPEENHLYFVAYANIDDNLKWHFNYQYATFHDHGFYDIFTAKEITDIKIVAWKKVIAPSCDLWIEEN